MYDVAAAGELFVDFTPGGKLENSLKVFHANPGGAPANVLSLLAGLGKKTVFIGKAGGKGFGLYLKNLLDSRGISTQGLILQENTNTTLAIVHLNENGDRSFSFYGKPGTDVLIDENEIDYSLLQNVKIFYFGSVYMRQEPCRTAVRKAVEYARNNGAVIAYDPNLRLKLWEDKQLAMEVILVPC